LNFQMRIKMIKMSLNNNEVKINLEFNKYD